jgi:hypothetical protein
VGKVLNYRPATHQDVRHAIYRMPVFGEMTGTIRLCPKNEVIAACRKKPKKSP